MPHKTGLAIRQVATNADTRDKAVSRSGNGPNIARLMFGERIAMSKSSIKYPLNFARREFIGTAFMVAVSLQCSPLHAKPKVPKKILFVCQYGTAKSAISREFFRQRARQRGIEVLAFSRGITIEDHVPPKLRQSLAKDGINPSIEPPQLLKPDDWHAADILVAFNQLPNDVHHPDIRDWTDLPSIIDEYKKARSIMKKRIEALLSEIDKG
jgi:arsenate reductase (thioredoxin)